MTTQDVLPTDPGAPPPAARPSVARPSRTFAVLAGLVTAGVALAGAELLAGLERTWRSPVLDVGDRLIDAAPPFVKEFAIDTFGTNDKPALLIGIGAFLAVYAAIVGVVALRHRLVLGVVGIGLFGVIGVWAASSRRASTPWHAVLPSVLGAAAGIAALVLIDRSLHRQPVDQAACDGQCDRAAPVPAALGDAARAPGDRRCSAGALGRCSGSASRRPSRGRGPPPGSGRATGAAARRA